MTRSKLIGDPVEVLGLATRFVSLDEARKAGASVEGSSAALRRALFAGAARV